MTPRVEPAPEALMSYQAEGVQSARPPLSPDSVCETGAELMGKTRVARLLERNREQEVRTARRLERAAPRLLKLAVV